MLARPGACCEPARPRAPSRTVVWHPVLVTSARALALAVLAAAALVGCSGDGDSAPPSATAKDAATTLREARATLDATSSVHFTLTSGDVPQVTAALLGGDGVAARPDLFQGALDVRVAGAQAKVDVVSAGGTLYAKLPFTSGFSAVDPEQFGLTDPGTFMSPDKGLTRLLGEATGASFGEKSRAGADVVQEVRATIPGAVVAEVLTTTDPSQPVPAVFGVVEGSRELRRATLTGPFFSRDTRSTYTLVLDRYGQKVDIRVPSGS